MIPLKKTLPLLLVLTLGGHGAMGLTHDTIPHDTIPHDTIPHDTIPQTQPVLSFNVAIPWGSSTATMGLTVPQNLGPLTVLFRPTAQCRGFQIGLETYNQWNPFTPTLIQNNKFLTQIQPVQGIKFNFIQSFSRNQLCQVTLVQDHVGPAPTNRTLLGSLKFSGGFQTNLTLELTAPVVVEKVAVFKPQYCQNIDIVESRLLLAAPSSLPTRSPLFIGETVTALATVQDQGEFLKATQSFDSAQATSSWYQIPLAAPTKIKGIAFSVAGPEAQSCEFPVYGWTRP